MRAGLLRTRVLIQAPTDTRNARGGTNPKTWSNIGKDWAAVMPLRGRELLHAAEVDSRMSHRIRMRYRDDVTPKMRLVAGTRAFNILGVANLDERGRVMELQAEEVVSGTG